MLTARLFGKNVRLSNALLRRVNFILTGVYVAQAVAIPLFGSQYFQPINLYFLTTDTLQSKLTGRPVSALASHQLLSINLAWMVSAWLIVMAGMQLALVTFNRKEFESGVQRGVNPLRWVALAAVWFLMTVSLGMLVGIGDLYTIVLFAGFTTFMGFCGYGMDIIVHSSKRSQAVQWPYDWMALLAAFAPLLIISMYIAATHVYGDGHVLSAYVYSLLATLVAFVCLFGANRKFIVRKYAAWRNNAYGELWYMLLSLAVTTAVAWQVFAAVLRP